ncbi:MAG: right-handed parallel beta-helix repeat-containing protein [Sedimentisphaerales bacterium]|nr:right-handed parallel beta-helix repeat-containing protein [Sedimentisphaerales bacterium]
MKTGKVGGGMIEKGNTFWIVMVVLMLAGSSQALTITAPNGGEKIAPGSTYTITWEDGASIAEVIIAYSIDNGQSWSEVAPPNAGNSGSYDWLVPDVDSNQCLVYIVDADNPIDFDLSDDLFTIRGPLYVDDNAPCDPGPGDPDLSDPCEDGSIEHPFDSIQESIDNAQNDDMILVADGTYTGTGNRDIDFRGKAVTLRSLNGPENCIIDCQGTPSEPHRGFWFGSGEGNDSILDGFTITNGYGPTESFANFTRSSGGAIFAMNNSTPTITRCRIVGNSAVCGGGLHCLNNIEIRNCIIAGNSAELVGGGVYFWGGSSVIISYCTITNNSAEQQGGGFYCYRNSHLTISHCIIWGNTASLGPEVSVQSTVYPSELTVLYSNVKGGQAAAYVESGCTLIWGEGNIDADPCFADPEEGDYHLRSRLGRYVSVDPAEFGGQKGLWARDDVTSPCIDAGDPAVNPKNELMPNGGRVNIGAYGDTEQASLSEWRVKGDINRDGIVNMLDLAELSVDWLWTAPWWE